MQHLPELVNMRKISCKKNKEKRMQNILFFQVKSELASHST